MMKKFPFKKGLCVIALFFILFFYVIRSKDHALFPKFKVKVTACNDTNAINGKWRDGFQPDLPVIFFVTPTYSRREQYPELVRLGQTVQGVPNLFWILVEDANSCSPHVTKLLQRFGSIPSVHLASAMPNMYQKELYKPRGVSSRNAALDWITANVNLKEEAGVIYFADDDNTYDLRLFDEIRSTKKVSMFPVGLIAKSGLSSPVVRDGHVIGFTDPWFANRKFPVDMAGFAFSLRLMSENSKARMSYKAGHEEDLFLKDLKVELMDIEPKANDCTEVLVWHTQTVKEKVPMMKLHKGSGGSNLNKLLNDLNAKGILHLSEKGKEVEICDTSNHISCS